MVRRGELDGHGYGGVMATAASGKLEVDEAERGGRGERSGVSSVFMTSFLSQLGLQGGRGGEHRAVQHDVRPWRALPLTLARGGRKASAGGLGGTVALTGPSAQSSFPFILFLFLFSILAIVLYFSFAPNEFYCI